MSFNIYLFGQLPYIPQPVSKPVHLTTKLIILKQYFYLSINVNGAATSKACVMNTSVTDVWEFPQLPIIPIYNLHSHLNSSRQCKNYNMGTWWDKIWQK